MNENYKSIFRAVQERVPALHRGRMGNRRCKIGESSGMKGNVRVFARKTKWTPKDDLAFYSNPPLFVPSWPKSTPIWVSATFTWDIEKAYALARAWSLHFNNVQVGGPAFGDPGGEFVPGRFIKKGVTFTSRGCPKKCPWCYVPKREGKIRELPIRDGWIVQDNNFAACSFGHQEKVFEMLSRQSVSASFPGGLDLCYLVEWHIEQFKKLQKISRLGALWVAFDTEKSMEELPRAKYLFADFDIGRCFAYVLIGYRDDTIEMATRRLEAVYDEERGFLPFAMLYDGNEEPEWKKLQRKWSRPAIYRSSAPAAHERELFNSQ